MNKKALRNKTFLMSNTFNRTKLFHSKKGWIISSALFFAILGFGAISESNVNANSTTSVVQNRPAKVSSISNVSNIQQRAQNLHKSIINTNINNGSSLSNNVQNNLASMPSDYSNNSKTSMFNTFHKPNNALPNNINLQANRDTTNQEGSYKGLTYTYNLSNNALEFINGKANGSFIHFISDAIGNNSCIKAAKSIKFDNNIDISQVPDMSFMFASDANLRSLDLGNNFNTINNTNTALMFHNDINLQSINLGPKFYTSKVRNMYEMFGNTTNKPSQLQSINLGSNFDTTNVNSMNGMFQGLTSLQTLIIPSVNTKFLNGIYLPAMYLRDANDTYTKLTPQNINNRNSCQGIWVTHLNTKPMIYSDIYNSFDNKNESIYSPSIPVGYTTVDSQGKPVQSPILNNQGHVQIAPVYHGLVYKYDKINNSIEFTGGKANGSFIHFISSANGNNSCIKNANSIKFDNDVDVSQVPDMSFMFASDSNLQSLDLGNNFNTTNNTNTALMFQNDTNLQSINLGPKFYTNNVSNMFGMFNNDNKLVSLNLGMHFNTSKVNNMAAMFQDDSNLQNFSLGSNFYTNNVTNMGNMFQGDSSLRNINFGSNFNTSKVANMSTMFQGDSSLQSINFGSNFDTRKVTDMSSLFQGDSSLRHLDLSKFDTSNVINMSGMFQGDILLSSLDLGKHFNTSNVKYMNAMFMSVPFLQVLDLGKYFDTTNVINMLSMFAQAPIQTLIINSSNTKFTPSAGLMNMYKKNGDHYSNVPNDFMNGNIGTFVNKNVVDNINPRFNPNQYISNNTPGVLSPRWNQNYHFNSPEGRSNDVESIMPVYNGHNIDHWDVYYLWDPDPQNVGNTAYGEWGEASTKNFVQFQPVDKNNPISINNVAIPCPTYEINGKGRVEVSLSDTERIPWYQVAGGSAISNKKHNGRKWISDLSSDARLAYFANYNPNNTGSYLAYANPNNDGGYQQFRPYSENNIFTGKDVGVGIKGDFRDPYITINPIHPNTDLTAYCAGGLNRCVFILTSKNARNWKKYNNNDEINLTNITHPGDNIETPYVTKLNNQPILFFSVQGANHSKEKVGYITGSYNQDGIFTLNTQSKYGYVDTGIDVYAGNFTHLDPNHLMFIGWLNNWGYFIGNHNGSFTIPRVLSWDGNNILTTPITPYYSKNISDKINNNTYAVNGKIDINFPTPDNTFNIKFTRVNDNHNNITFSFKNSILTVTRKGSANSISDSHTITNISMSKLSSIQFYLDNDSIEAYIPETHQMYSILDYDNVHNTPYIITSNTDNKINSVQFNINRSPVLDDISIINNEYSADKANFTKDLNVINNKSDASNAISLLNSYFNDIQDQLQNANTNINQANLYNNDARQHSYIALANDAMNLAKIRLYQASIQLNYLDKIAADTPRPTPTNSQSNQDSGTDQNNGSNVQPNDNTMPFIPSFNIPTMSSTSVATSIQNNNDGYSSVISSSKSQAANSSVQMSESTKSTESNKCNVKHESVYLFNTDFKGLSKHNRSVTTIKGFRAYKHTRKGRYVPVKNIKPNTKLAVKRVIKFGKITKLQLTNDWLVTSNKHFVHVNRRFAKRNIKGMNASRYTRALRKSNHVLRHDRRHATRYTYRMVKNFNKANKAEKKAYRKFVRKHTNYNYKIYNKSRAHLNKLINALLR